MLEITQPDSPGREVERSILDILMAYNEQAAGPDRWAPLALILQEPGNPAIQGDLWAETYYDWRFIRLLVVPAAARHQGLGRQLMARAETIARARNCTGIWLDTFSFQALGFYEKLGFSPFGKLNDHPTGSTRTFLQKQLTTTQPP